MLSTWTAISSRMFLRRSWVIGRGVTTPWRARAMAAASACPIQMGRNRSPSASRRRTMGWFVGSSIRTPASDISIMASSGNLALPSPSDNLGGAVATGVGRGLGPRDTGEVWNEEVRVRRERGEVLHGKDIGQVPVSLLEVEAISHHEHVGAIESHVPDGKGRDAAHGLVQKRAYLHRGGLPRFQDRDQVREREPRVDDVFDDQDDTPADVYLQVLHDPDSAHRLRRAPIPGDR